MMCVHFALAAMWTRLKQGVREQTDQREAQT